MEYGVNNKPWSLEAQNETLLDRVFLEEIKLKQGR